MHVWGTFCQEIGVIGIVVGTTAIVDNLQKQLRDSTNDIERQRSQIILMSNQNMNVKSLSIALQLSRDTIERCLDGYEFKGFKFLKDLPRSDRPCILDDSEKNFD